MQCSRCSPVRSVEVATREISRMIRFGLHIIGTWDEMYTIDTLGSKKYWSWTNVVCHSFTIWCWATPKKGGHKFRTSYILFYMFLRLLLCSFWCKMRIFACATSLRIFSVITSRCIFIESSCWWAWMLSSENCQRKAPDAFQVQF